MSNVTGESVGIDLGTTYSCVGVWQNDRVEIIANDQGNRITPSYVSFTDEERLIGEAAKNQATVSPTQTLFDVKRTGVDIRVLRNERYINYCHQTKIDRIIDRRHNLLSP